MKCACTFDLMIQDSDAAHLRSRLQTVQPTFTWLYTCRLTCDQLLSTSRAHADYTNLGCYALRPDRPPLPQLLLDSPKMTPGFCYKKAAAYKFFALFNGTRCYAGSDLAPSLRHGRGSTGCTASCFDKKQTCGGPAAFVVYVNHAPQVTPAAVPLTLAPVGEAQAPAAAPSLTPSELGRAGLLSASRVTVVMASYAPAAPPCHPTHPILARLLGLTCTPLCFLLPPRITHPPPPCAHRLCIHPSSCCSLQLACLLPSTHRH
jgi:hypothetical protein